MLRIFAISLGILYGCQNFPIETNKSQETAPIIEQSLEVETKQNKEQTMQDFLNSTIGTASVLVLVYIAGGVTFAPLWTWAKSKIPFLNK